MRVGFSRENLSDFMQGLNMGVEEGLERNEILFPADFYDHGVMLEC